MTEPLLTDIKVYENVLKVSDVHEIEKIASRPRWLFGASSDVATPFKKFWKMDVRGVSMFAKVIPERMKTLLPFEFEILDYYLNGYTRGLDGAPHKDDADYTFLIYCNPHWDLQWGGKTVFVQDDGKFDVVFPKPFSAVLFPSKLLHWAEDVTREFYGIRITAAYKLKKLEDTSEKPTDI